MRSLIPSSLAGVTQGLAACPRAVRPGTQQSECEAQLHFEAAVARSFEETFAVRSAGDLVGLSEQWRRNVPINGPGIGVIENIAARHAEAEVIAAADGRVGKDRGR